MSLDLTRCCATRQGDGVLGSAGLGMPLTGSPAGLPPVSPRGKSANQDAAGRYALMTDKSCVTQSAAPASAPAGRDKTWIPDT